MKKDCTIIALIIPAIMGVLSCLPGCYRNEIISGKDKKAYLIVPGRDYQIELEEDSILVFDGHRHVGTIPMWDNSPLDSLLQKDNE